MGRRGKRIVFSCTWNENRKKDMDDVNSAKGNIDNVGIGRTDPALPSVAVGRIANPPRISPTTLGKNPTAVKPVDSFTRTSLDAQFFHLNATFDAHQKLATLSSNSPLPNGNMRVMGSRMAGNGEKGGRKGEKRRINVRTVTKPRRINKRPLDRE